MWRTVCQVGAATLRPQPRLSGRKAFEDPARIERPAAVVTAADLRRSPRDLGSIGSRASIGYQRLWRSMRSLSAPKSHRSAIRRQARGRRRARRTRIRAERARPRSPGRSPERAACREAAHRARRGRCRPRAGTAGCASAGVDRSTRSDRDLARPVRARQRRVGSRRGRPIPRGSLRPVSASAPPLKVCPDRQAQERHVSGGHDDWHQSPRRVPRRRRP